MSRLDHMTPRFTLVREKDDSSPAKSFTAIRPYGGARLIMADPPWRHLDWSTGGNKAKTPGHQYQTQSLAWIEALPVEVLAAHDCLLWLWATAPLLPQAIGVAQAWGFEFKTCGVWVKRTVHGKLAIGTGRRLRSSHEPFILAARGKPPVATAVRSALVTYGRGAAILNDADPFTSIGVTVEAVRREHSRKPDEAYEAARKCVEGPSVELFARERREGWTVWGNETDKFTEAAE